ncbi:MAG: hypothetical protein AAF570_03280 [Bacteroidota bacterium]
MLRLTSIFILLISGSLFGQGNLVLPTGARACAPCSILGKDSTSAWYQYNFAEKPLAIRFNQEPDMAYKHAQNWKKVRACHGFDPDPKNEGWGRGPQLRYVLMIDRDGRPAEICTMGQVETNDDFKIVPCLEKIRFRRLLFFERPDQEYRFTYVDYDLHLFGR